MIAGHVKDWHVIHIFWRQPLVSFCLAPWWCGTVDIYSNIDDMRERKGEREKELVRESA